MVQCTKSLSGKHRWRESENKDSGIYGICIYCGIIDDVGKSQIIKGEDEASNK